MVSYVITNDSYWLIIIKMLMMMMMMMMMMMIGVVVIVTINMLLVMLLLISLMVLVEVSDWRTLACKSVETPAYWLADQPKFANFAAVAASLVVHPRCHLHLRHNSITMHGGTKNPHGQNSSGWRGSLNASRSQPMAFRFSPKTVEWRADSGQGIWKTPAPGQGHSPHCLQLVNGRQRLQAQT